MLIERMRGSENGAVHPATWDQIRAVESQAHQIFVDFVRESGEVVGQNYTARIVTGSQLDEDLQPYIEDTSRNCFVQETVTPYVYQVSVFDMTSLQGVHKEKLDDSDKPEYWELSDHYWGRMGSRLLEEIFKPGEHPELSELALAKKSQLVDPDELPARIMTFEEHKRATAVARLSQFTLTHLDHILQLYNQIAYSDSRAEPRVLQENTGLHARLRKGESVGLRTGTKYLGCAKHELRSRMHEDELKTWMYLNYDIAVGPVNLHFRDDIAMAVDYGDETTAYFTEQEISLP